MVALPLASHACKLAQKGSRLRQALVVGGTTGEIMDNNEEQRWRRRHAGSCGVGGRGVRAKGKAVGWTDL